MKHFFLFSLACLLGVATGFAQDEPYKNADLTPEERANDLLPRLTLEEKVGMLMNDSKAVDRLGIPAYNWWNEALHGVARAGLATVFPQTIGMAASFDNDAVYRVFTAVSDEARAKYHKFQSEGKRKIYQGLTFWTPNINIFRDPRWGRGQETYGEDPFLTARMGVAVINGLQGDMSQKFLKTNACAKHFAVHSGPEWNRHSFNAEDIAPRDLWETYLPAFKAAVEEANVKQVMCAYNRYEGDPCCGSDKLLVQILRKDWNYPNIVVSDCGAIDDFYVKGRHETHNSPEKASAVALISGTDVECGSSYRSVVKAIQEGLITEEEVDKHVKRLLIARFELGNLDPDSLVPWSKIPYSVVNCDEHKDLALEIAQKSIVLLQNKNNILPLSKNSAKIAVMGPNAVDSTMQWGNYNGTASHTVTILDGIQEKLGCPVKYVRGCDCVETLEADFTKVIAEMQDVETVIFVGGINPRLEGEQMRVDFPGFKGGDRTTIELPSIQTQLMQQLKQAGKKVVFVNCSGSSIALLPESQSCDAIVQAWYPGEQGGTAVANVLFGDYNPSGKLPVTFYQSTEQLPDYEDYSMKGRTYRYFEGEPLFCFGHGLSYTTFGYGKAKLSQKKIAANENVTFTVPVSNKGERAGDEVVQLYVRRLNDANAPLKTLRAYQRINLQAGETKTVTFELTPSAFEFFDESTNTVRTQPGNYEIMVGGDSKNLKSYKLAIK